MDDDDLVRRLRAAGCVFAESEAALLRASATDVAELARMVDERCSGVPVEHILGWAEFDGGQVAVEPGVFVPRGRTAFLVDLAAAVARPGMAVVDLCCGSGAVALALSRRVSGLDLHASDVDDSAVRCARRNLRGRAHVHQGDLFDALPRRLRGRVDVVVANAPYVPTDDIAMMPAEARDHEPRAALDGGPDGVEVHRRIAAEASRWLTGGGTVLIETSRAQAALTEGAFRDHRFRTRIDRDPDRESTVVTATS